MGAFAHPALLTCGAFEELALTSKYEVAGPIWRACIHRLSREEFLSSACCSVVVLTAK